MIFPLMFRIMLDPRRILGFELGRNEGKNDMMGQGGSIWSSIKGL
jgi:hypothetical protein